jgi:F-type H+-transporting ATPase subunit gamma
MSQNFERAKSRLDNISAIEPLLGALRTMSMGTWQMALKKLSQMKAYEDNYQHISAEILPLIKKSQLKRKPLQKKAPELSDTIILIIGTERGLCGKFNETLISKSLDWIEKSVDKNYQIWAMGTRMIRKLDQANVKLAWRQTRPTSDLATYQQAYLTSKNWVEQFEEYAFNQFYILHNQPGVGSQYVFSAFKLLPFEIDEPPNSQSKIKKSWPPPIIETEPLGIYHQILQHFIASNYYRILLKSAAAEHAARFNLMQEAKDNADDIIEELRRVINAERKRKITQEMQELAAGAGLMDNN